MLLLGLEKQVCKTSVLKAHSQASGMFLFWICYIFLGF